VDLLTRPVTSGAGEKTSYCKPEDDGSRAHKRGAYELDDNDGREDAESKANEFGVAPAKMLDKVQSGTLLEKKKVVPTK